VVNDLVIPQAPVDRHVRRSGDDYARALIGLLPHGQAWPRYPGSTLVLTMEGVADYWGFVDGRAADLLEIESDPRLTFELLPDWERNWGLPDPCLRDPPTSLSARRQALVAKMTLIGAQSRAFFYNVANEFGQPIGTIEEFAPYMCGVSRCGDESGIYNPDEPTRNRWTLGPPEMRYYWTVHVNALGFTHFYCNSSQTGIDRLLGINIATDVECILDRLKPAQTHIVYNYSPREQLDFTQLYNSQYLALGML
jgi:uncharacterized protein YmfQ (DUF2313 family)